MSKVTVHWAYGDVVDFDGHFGIKAKYQEEGKPLVDAWLCSKDEADIDVVALHFSKSIEPYHVSF
jgi:hypothetical protein